MTKNFRSIQKWILLLLLGAGITFLHYSTDQSRYYYHVFYGELYFLPIILAVFWFGLRGALLVSVSISVCYLPFIFLHWQSFSPNDMDGILSLFLYNGLAVITGGLKDRETTARKKLLRAENLAVMGRSLAAVAHDMKSPLMLIGGFARQILKKMGDKDPARTKLTIIVKETEKMESMTGDILNFSKPLKLNPIRGSIDIAVQNALMKVSEAALRHYITLEYRSDHEKVDISFDALRSEQLIVNLLLNAIEASSEGGTVTVTLSRTSRGQILDVADNGCGIPFVKRQQVFDPFFTTKKEGTGLGLSIVTKIVEAHDWSLQILDNEKGGALFRINLLKA